MAETLQLAGTTGTMLFALTLEDLLEAEELGISEDHAHKLLAAVLAEAPPGDEPEPEPEAAAYFALKWPLSYHVFTKDRCNLCDLR